LRDEGVLATVGPMPRPTAAPAPAPAQPPSAPVPGPAGGRGDAVVLRVEVARAAGALADRLVGHPALAGLDVAVSPGTRTEHHRYRGTHRQVERPCLQVAVTCPRARVELVRSVLGSELGVP